MSLHENIGKELDGMGGYLECTTCKTKKPLGSTSGKLANGWPKCCGYTMTWITQRLIDEAATYGTDCRNGTCE